MKPSSEYPVNSHLWVLSKFLECLKEEKWADLVKYTLKTYVFYETSHPEESLLELFKNKKIISVDFLMNKYISPLCVDVWVNVSYVKSEHSFRAMSKKVEIPIKLIKESSPFQPSEQGDWGVSPYTIALRLN